jgi:ATP phosphoribosyltransferase
VCPTKQVGALADWLIGKGAQSVTSSKLDYVFHAGNALWGKLSGRLQR